MSDALVVTRKEEAAIRTLVTKETGLLAEFSVRESEQTPEYVYFTLARIADLELEFWIESAFPNLRDVWVGFRFLSRKLLDAYVTAVVDTKKFGGVPKSPDSSKKLEPETLYQDRGRGGYWIGYYEVAKAGETSVEATRRLLRRYSKIQELQEVLLNAEIAVEDKIEGNARGRDFYLRATTLCQAVRKRANGRCEHCEDDVVVRYGKDILQVHHAQKRFSELEPREKITPESLKAVCPNCHSAIHAYCQGRPLRWKVKAALPRPGAKNLRKPVVGS